MTLNLRSEDLFSGSSVLDARTRLTERWYREGYFGATTVAGYAERAASTHGATSLVFHSDERPCTLSLEQLWRRATKMAGAFSARGVRRGDAIAVQLPNWAETAIAYVAASVLGAVVIPIVHSYGPSETDWILSRAEPKVFVLPGRWSDQDYSARLDEMPAVARIETVVVVGDHARSGTSTWDDLEGGMDLPIRPEPFGSDEPFLVIYTSGTTGEPKGIVHSHNSFLAELKSMPSPPRSLVPIRAMQPWPPGHIAGMTAIMGPLVHGFDTYLVDKFDAASLVELIGNENISAASAVPTVIFRVMDEAQERGVALPLRELTTGGAGIPPLLIERGEELGWHIARCYGSSEHPSATASAREDSRAQRHATDGSPMLGTEVRILRDDHTECATGEEGEIALIGPEQFSGYTDPDLNRECFTKDGWLLTGDIGILDPEGFLVVTDRKKDLIIRGGENISSVEVEEILVRHSAVAEAAAVASPDPLYGERVCAFVILHPGASLTLSEVQDHFADLGVQRQKTPELLKILAEDFPRTASGKVLKSVLRESLLDRS